MRAMTSCKVVTPSSSISSRIVSSISNNSMSLYSSSSHSSCSFSDFSLIFFSSSFYSLKGIGSEQERYIRIFVTPGRLCILPVLIHKKRLTLRLILRVQGDSIESVAGVHLLALPERAPTCDDDETPPIDIPQAVCNRLQESGGTGKRRVRH